MAALSLDKPQQVQDKPADKPKDDHIIISYVTRPTGPKQDGRAGKDNEASPPSTSSNSGTIPWSSVKEGDEVVFLPDDAKAATKLKGTVVTVRKGEDGKMKVTLKCGRRVSVTVSEGKGVLKEQTQEKVRSEKPRYEKAVGLVL